MKKQKSAMGVRCVAHLVMDWVWLTGTAIMLAGFVGCATKDPLSSTAHFSQTLKLTPESPEAIIGKSGATRVRLLSISEDGTTRLVIVGSTTTLAVRPGEFFSSREFGLRGLRLLSASKSDGTATVEARWADKP